MQQVFGIVSEFNPFHNGHAFLANKARENGATHLVAVMSGNFVQRGCAAITDKRVRARCAINAGIDLVVELPLAHATATAQRFGKSAVNLLLATGIIDGVCFGSESDDISALHKLAKAVESPEVNAALAEHLASGITFAKARQLATAQILGEDIASQLSTPNNALAVEYLREMHKLNWNAKAIAVTRNGTAHDSDFASGEYASASFLRKNCEDFSLMAAHTPPQCADIMYEASQQGLYPFCFDKLDAAMLFHLRRLGKDELERLPDLSEGLDNRMLAAIRRCTSVEELTLSLKTKRYTMARVRRLILSAFLGVTAEDWNTKAPYLRVIGFNERGKQLLTQMKQTATLPVDTSLLRLERLGGDCSRFAQLESSSTDLYTLALPKPLRCGYEYTASGIYV